MRHLMLFLVLGALAVSAAHAQVACPGGLDDHTNPPIILKKGNSLVWAQCDRTNGTWKKMEATYNVFKENGKCDPDYKYLDDDFFGTATKQVELGNASDKRYVWIHGDEYRLVMKFKRKKPTSNPNTIKLCKNRGRCCTLNSKSDNSLQGKIPYEFETFKKDEINYGAFWSKKGTPPLSFETCRNPNCKRN